MMNFNNEKDKADFCSLKNSSIDSMNYFIDQYLRNRKPHPYIGWVVFARTQPPDWVTALFQMR